MYNFNLIQGEEIIQVFDDILVKQENNQKNTTIALTNKRLLFLDYVNDEASETLRVARGLNYIRYKEVYHKIDLTDIETVEKRDYYVVTLKDKTSFEFSESKLFNLLKNNNF